MQIRRPIKIRKVATATVNPFKVFNWLRKISQYNLPRKQSTIYVLESLANMKVMSFIGWMAKIYEIPILVSAPLNPITIFGEAAHEISTFATETTLK